MATLTTSTYYGDLRHFLLLNNDAVRGNVWLDDNGDVCAGNIVNGFVIIAWDGLYNRDTVHTYEGEDGNAYATSIHQAAREVLEIAQKYNDTAFVELEDDEIYIGTGGYGIGISRDGLIPYGG